MKRNRFYIWFILLIPLVVYGAIYLYNGSESQYPTYSILNRSRLGCSVFFESLQEMDFPVERTEETVDSFPAGTVQIVSDQMFGNFDVHSSGIDKWVKEGGILVYLTPNNFYFNTEELIPKFNGEIQVYDDEKGYIIAADVLSICNKTLLKETEEAYKLLETLDKYDYKKIYFNENHMYSYTASKSLWDFTPPGIRLIIYQIILALIAYFYYRGKRFGKPIPYYEEVERVENEYLYSASSLYRQAECYDIILENYYHDFIRELDFNGDNWLKYWESEGFSNLNSARRVYNAMENRQSKPGGKEAANLISMIEKLKEQLEKRREKKWKSMRE